MTDSRWQDIEHEYSAGPNDWLVIRKDITDAYRFDPMTTVTLDADVAMILLACRDALIAREAKEAS